MAEAFQAPEGVWNPDADRIRIDVFALGALAYYVLSGRMPAADRTTLRERLNRDRGLDLAVDLPQVTPALRALVLDATRPAVTERLPDVRAFLDRLDEAEAAAEPGEDVIDPLEAAPGAVIDGRFRLQRRLGTGSTAMGLLVNDLAIAESGPDSVRVLKVALDTQAAGRLVEEAKVLAGLRHPRLVRLVEGPIDVGGRQALVLESAGDQTLGEVLREQGAAFPGPSRTVGHRPAGSPGRAGPRRGRSPGHQAREPGHQGDQGEARGPGQAPGAVRLLPVQGCRDRRDGGHAALPGPVPGQPPAGPVRLRRGTLLGRRRPVRDGDRVGSPVRRRAVGPGVGPGRGRRRARHVRPCRRRQPDGLLPDRPGPRCPGRHDTAAEMLTAWQSVFQAGAQDGPGRRRGPGGQGGNIHASGAGRPVRACPVSDRAACRHDRR